MQGIWKAWGPPARMTVSEWADSFGVLPSDSAEPGRFKTNRTPYMKEVVDAFTDPSIKKIVVKSAAQIGKALDINCPIATPDGFKTMGELQVGDKVFDERGEVCNVIGVSPIMYNHDCYEVTFSDGARIVADAEHNWIANGQHLKTTELKVGMTIPDIVLTDALLKVILQQGEENEDDEGSSCGDSDIEGGVRKRLRTFDD